MKLLIFVVIALIGCAVALRERVTEVTDEYKPGTGVHVHKETVRTGSSDGKGISGISNIPRISSSLGSDGLGK